MGRSNLSKRLNFKRKSRISKKRRTMKRRTMKRRSNLSKRRTMKRSNKRRTMKIKYRGGTITNTSSQEEKTEEEERLKEAAEIRSKLGLHPSASDFQVDKAMRDRMARRMGTDAV